MTSDFERQKPELAKQIDQVLKSQPALDSFPPLKLGDDGFTYLLDKLEYPVYSVFHLDGRGLTDASIPRLVDYIRSQDKVRMTGIDLSHNHFTPAGIEKLIDAVAEHPRLTMLKLDGNPLSGGGETLARLIERLPHQCTVFSAEKAGLTDRDFEAIIPVVASHPSLRTIDLSFQPISEETARRFLEGAMHKNTHLEQIGFKQDIETLGETVESLFLKNPVFNLLMVTPAPSNSVLELFDNNAIELQRVRSWVETSIPYDLTRGKLPDFSGKQIREIERHAPVVFSQASSIKNRTQAKTMYETFLSNLPKLPGQGEGFSGALFHADVNGYAPLDNPGLWSGPEAAKEVLRRVPLSPEFLSRRTEKGSTIVDSLLDYISADELIEEINSQGVILGKKYLLDGKAEPTALYGSFTERRRGVALFSTDNCLAQEPHEIRAAFEVLPEYQKAQVALQQLLLDVGKAAPATAVGR